MSNAGMKKIGFIGLGVIGAPIAGHLSRKGFGVSVFNRSPNKSNTWKSQYSGIVCKSSAELAITSDVIILCVGNDEDVRDIIIGNKIPGIIDNVRPGLIVIDHTTTSANLSREMNKALLAKDCHFIDAPVSGGQSGAEDGSLTIMVGGEKEVYEESLDVLAAYSKYSKYMGESGSGQLTKMVNQIAIAGLLQSLSEAVNFSEKSGLNSEDVFNVISKGAAQSWQMDNRWQTMLKDEFDFGFAVDWMRKDLDIVSDEAGRIGANIHVTELVNNFYKQIQEDGGGRLDTSSLARRIKKLS
jgi:3-hydroxyisobutyrate dehydrogenase-like beta-hydroxyacid dehydrogenase